MKHLILMFLALLPFPLWAAVTPPPKIDVAVYSFIGYPVLRARRSITHTFNAQVELPGGYLPKGDLYFGVLQPGNKNAHTWAGNEDDPELLKGMHPLVEDMSLRAKSPLAAHRISREGFEHAFADSDQPGMYMVFLLIVIADTNPADPNNWYAVEMMPLFVE